MGSDVSLFCALLLLLHYGREGAALVITTTSTGDFLTGNDITLTIYYNSANNGTVTWAVNGTTVATWQKGSSIGPLVSDAYKGRLTITGNGSLLITNTSKSDAGTYSVSVNLLNESPSSRNFQVTFYDPVRNVTVSQSPLEVSEGTPVVNLTCSASSGIQKVTWTKDGKSVGYNDSYILSDGNQTLRINQPNRTYTGNYSCNISNPVDWGYASFILNVSYSDTPASLSAGAIAGIVIGSVVGAILIIALIILLVCCIRKRKKGEKEKNPAGPYHNEVIRTVSGATLSPDDPAFFTLNNIMYRNSSISMGSYIINSSDYASEKNNRPSPNSSSSPAKVKHATQV
ncbi:cell adhesion molecule CEACAM2-like [Mixophyes fleayi]|uniref:cell adhesion molecule CEACAM2-like n=1 Tax=Mixophyes fleayi TaxID=3061075 RepID=UPI003F4DC4A5